jgi:CspA family cold shock protein|tara:strand:+ start:133 stop:345 length:213 start_codon:yes stop_codon:yes gene_type:complete
MSTFKGTVKWFNGKKGFGFIEREDKEKDAFVHASAVKAAGMRFLNEGDKLEFEMEEGPKGPSAINLKKID